MTMRHADSSLNLSRLALGTVQFGQNYGIANKSGQVSLEVAAAILKIAAESGLYMLDTAVEYGESEQRLGDIGIDGWQVVSKLPAIHENCGNIGKWVNESVEKCLERLKVKQLHALLLHRPQQLMGHQGNELYSALLRLKGNGLVRKIGISIYDPVELDAIHGRYDIDLVQAPLNVIDRRLVDSGWLARLADQKVELHVRSVFLQGLLLMPPSIRPKQFDTWAPFWAVWDEWLDQAGVTPLQACLKYVLSLPEISKVVIGVESVSQLKQILEATEVGVIPIVPRSLAMSDSKLINPVHWQRVQ